MYLRTHNRRNPAKVVRTIWCAVPADVLPTILLDTVRFLRLIERTFQQKVQDVVGERRVFGKSQMVGKNEVDLSPVYG